jgi:hypothetical protein
MGLIVNIDKIEKIYTYKAKQAPYVGYVEGQSEKRVFFGLIKKQSEVKPHWESYTTGVCYSREDLIDADNLNKYYINNEVLYEHSIWQKPYINIVMSHSENVTVYYDSYDELLDKVNKIISQSVKNLMVINN